MSTLYDALIKQYMDLRDQEKEFKQKKDEIREQIASLMHDEGVCDKMLEIDGKEYLCTYQGRETLKCNYDALLETVGQNVFNQLVSKNESVTLYIKEAPKGKAKGKSFSSPKPLDDNLPKPPKGIFS
jgi:hypothetical protein